ncbi:YhcH/YjgK/YiaL family protein [Prevotella herbatica]|uniref:YhcH/YjgK/YiaL family protein n=2 Tax=Prevotella herbatica TaxID=2801997 RepID=A0ABN6EKX9_9BACT|nr:YhcH/YjgK/YiaL family protein [Prevotella herbatica]
MCTLCAHGQHNGYYTQYYNNPELLKQAKTWVESGEWRQGFNGAAPHSSVNVIDFYQQYQRNPKAWQAMFHWLATHDLLAIPAGRHEIEGTDLVASVEDSENRPLEKQNSESHYHHIDFQYVVSGVERFGILDHYTSTPNCKYDARKDVIHYNYKADRTRFYDSKPDEFFIFFPRDWHIAKINNSGNDQKIRVIVVKQKAIL